MNEADGRGPVDRTVGPTRQQCDGFTRDELLLDYAAWSDLSEHRKKHLSADAREWLGAWTLWDFACSPMDDSERRLLRYGHWLGWWHCRSQHEQPNA